MKEIVGRAVFCLLVSLALAPFAFILIGPLVSARFSQQGDINSTIWLYANSWLLALIVSTIASSIGFYLVFVRRSLVEAALITLTFLFLPGEIVGVGTDRLMASVLHLVSPLVQKVAFVTALIGFVLPYVIITLIIALFAIGSGRLVPLSELTSSPLGESRVILRAYWKQILIAWLIGINLTICESARTSRLQEDLFGLGRKYFGPAMNNLFEASGVEIAFVALSLLPLAPVLGLFLLSSTLAKPAR